MFTYSFINNPEKNDIAEKKRAHRKIRQTTNLLHTIQT